MANTISVMTNAVRGVVSKKRIRYQENGYDLDLAYVTENLIAMGFPAGNIEKYFRNSKNDVHNFLEEIHKNHYKVYNLCSEKERQYDADIFHGRVGLYPFEDHNPPPIKMIKEFCDDVDAWLKADKNNVAAVHCKAGKGRTGTMICCYLLHCHMKPTAEMALTYYDEKRTKNRKGVTIPSQRRYVEYYAKLIISRQPYEERTLQICEMKFSPQLSNQDNIYCSIYPNPRSEDAESHNITLSFRKTQMIEINDRCIPLTGDVKIEVYRKVMKRKEKFFHFWLNTYFVCDNATVYEDDNGEKKFVYELSKFELDDAHKDTEHKTVPQDFKVQLAFKAVPKYHHTTMPSTTPTIACLTNDSNSLHKVNHSSLSTFGPQQNHHSHYNQLNHSNNIGMNNHHHNAFIPSLMPRPNATNNINNISELTSMNKQRIPNATRLSSVGSSSSSRSSTGDQQQQQQQQMYMVPSPSSSTMLDANCYPNQLEHNQQLQEYHSHKYQRHHNTNFTTNAITSDKDEFNMSKSEPRSPAANGSSPQVANQQPLKLNMSGSGKESISTSIAAGTELHTPSASSDVSRTNSSSRSSSINSSEVSSQSACCGGDGGDEEEDWESGESSILSKRKEKLNDKTDIENENDHENSILMAMMDADDSFSTVHVNNIHSPLVSSSSLHNLSQDSSGNDCNKSFEHYDSIVRNDKCRNPNLITLQSNSTNNNNSCNNNHSNNKASSICMDKNVEKTSANNFMKKTASSGSDNSSSKLILIEEQNQQEKEGSNAPIAFASFSGCSKLMSIAAKPTKSSTKSLGKHNNIGNNNNANKKMQKARRWLSSMKSDPDFDTLAKSVNFRKTATKHPSNRNSDVMINETGTECNRITDLVSNTNEEAAYIGSDNNGRGLNCSLLNHRTRTNSTSDHDDFYSSLCDKQLSFGGSSPMKSPLNSIDRIKLRGETMDQKIFKHGHTSENILTETNVVVAKPIASCAIGFKVPSIDVFNPACEIVYNQNKDIVKDNRRNTENILHAVEKQHENKVNVNQPSISSFDCSEKQLKTVSTSPLTSRLQVCTSTISVTPSNATLSTIRSEDPKMFALISSSPPADKANRCAPFSFHKLRQNLDSVLKSKSTKSSNSSGKTGRTTTTTTTTIASNANLSNNDNSREIVSGRSQQFHNTINTPLTTTTTSFTSSLHAMLATKSDNDVDGGRNGATGCIYKNNSNATDRDKTKKNDHVNVCDEDIVGLK